MTGANGSVTGTSDSVPRTDVAEHIWRLRIMIFLAVFSAYAIEMVSVWLRTSAVTHPVVPRVISMAALVLLCSAALYLIFLLQGRYILKWMVTLATLFLVVDQTFAILRTLPYWQSNYEAFLSWTRRIDNPLMLGGLILLLTTFYFALLETVSVKALLRKERLDLYKEISERERVQMELRKSRDQLRRLSQHVQDVREDERARVARELHDELGQTLTSLKIDLGTLSRQLSSGNHVDVKCLEIMTSMQDQISATVAATRRIMSELHPPILDELGLRAAIEWLVSEFQKRHRIRCRTELDLNGIVLNREKSRAVFRIVQECLTNIARHAQATEVDVKLHSDNGRVVLEVGDNGRGMSELPAPEDKRFGIMGMQERVTLLGGEFNVQSGVGQGTRISVAIPTGEVEA